jgi:hypothetical protein
MNASEPPRGLTPSNFAALVQSEMRTRNITYYELPSELGISQPQLAGALFGLFDLSPETAARLLVWLRKAA